MRNNRYSFVLRLVLLAVIVVLPILLLTNVARAAQVPPVKNARWILELSFQNGTINARRINQIYDGNTLTEQWDQPITCQKKGAITIGATSAIFNGGYLLCNLPNFRLEVQAHTQGLVNLKKTCTISGNKVNVWGQAMLRNVDFTKGNRHPIFSHPAYEMAYAVEKSGTDVTMILDAGSESEESLPFVFLSGSNEIGSRIQQCNGSTCTTQHMLNGSNVNTAQIPQVAAWTVTTGASTIYIGREGSLRFYGELFSLRDDPGCVAQPS